MSWAADNPEVYDEIMKTGIITKLTKELNDNGFENIDGFTFAVVEVLYETTVREALVRWSQQEITEAEADHFANVDDARAE